MNREEILSLPNKTDEEQIEWLKRNGVLRRQMNKHGLCVDYHKFESLPEAAFRLRDEAEKTFLLGTRPDLAMVYNAVLFGHTEYASHEIPASGMGVWIWFASQAKPIHWIMAALLAKKTQ